MRGNKHMEGFCVTPEEHEAIEKAAKKYRMTKSVMIRMMVFGQLPPIEIKEGEA